MYETSSSAPHLESPADKRSCITARAENTSAGIASVVTTRASTSLLSSKSPIASEPERYMPRKLVPRMARTSDRNSRRTLLMSGYGVGCGEGATKGTCRRLEYTCRDGAYPLYRISP